MSQQIYLVNGGTVVHLTTTCSYVKHAEAFVQKSLAEVKAALKGEPRVCATCKRLARRAKVRHG